MIQNTCSNIYIHCFYTIAVLYGKRKYAMRNNNLWSRSLKALLQSFGLKKTSLLIRVGVQILAIQKTNVPHEEPILTVFKTLTQCKDDLHTKALYRLCAVAKIAACRSIDSLTLGIYKLYL